MTVDAEVQVKKCVNIRTCKIYTKVSDSFTYSLIDSDGDEVFDQDHDYVPSFMPGEHYGDYIIMEIDVDNGVILNWSATSEEFKTVLEAEKD